MTARAYVYTGLWVADCPRGCGNVEKLPSSGFACSYCHYETADVEWPSDPVMISAVLNLRPVPHTRNWYPAGHDVAVRSGIPHGQTPADLLAENYEYGVT
jgi:hypothetical protein